jgi:hypothetical protein
LGKRLAMWSHLNLLEEIPKVNGSATLQIREQAQVQKQLYAAYESNASNCVAFMDYLGVSHITAPGAVIEWAARTNYLPLVTAGQKPVFAEPISTLTALLQPGFDPRQVVYLPLEARAAVSLSEAGGAAVRSVRFRPQMLEFEIEARHACIVSVAQSFYPAWRAYVDGQSARLWPANYAFQAMVVPAGRHHVTVAYEDRWFRAGLAISLLSLAGFLIMWFAAQNGSNRRLMCSSKMWL